MANNLSHIKLPDGTILDIASSSQIDIIDITATFEAVHGKGAVTAVTSKLGNTYTTCGDILTAIDNGCIVRINGRYVNEVSSTSIKAHTNTVYFMIVMPTTATNIVGCSTILGSGNQNMLSARYNATSNPFPVVNSQYPIIASQGAFVNVPPMAVSQIALVGMTLAIIDAQSTIRYAGVVDSMSGTTNYVNIGSQRIGFHVDSSYNIVVDSIV